MSRLTKVDESGEFKEKAKVNIKMQNDILNTNIFFTKLFLSIATSTTH